MARVWELSAARGADLLMLLAIADFSDDDGRAYPSVQTLALKCRVSARNANKTLARLRDTGELRIDLSRGPHGCNQYRVTVPATPVARDTPVVGDTLAQTTAPPVVGDPKPLSSATPKPSVNHHEPPVIQATGKPAAVPATKPVKAQAMTEADLVAEGVEPDAARDWLAARRAKRQPLTATAWKGIVREAAAARLTPAQAVTVAAERGWCGFRASWLEATGTRGKAPAAEPAWRTEQRARSVAFLGPAASAEARAAVAASKAATVDMEPPHGRPAKSRIGFAAKDYSAGGDDITF